MADYAELHVYSGTGNSLKIAEWAKQQLAADGWTARIIPVTSRSGHHVADNTKCIGLFTPTHGFTAPWAMIRYALLIPRARQKRRCFVMPARAGTKLYWCHLPGFEGTTGYLLALIMLLKGYRIQGVMAVDMPSNWLAVHPGFREAAISTIAARAENKTKHFIATLIRGQHRFPPGSIISLILGILLTHISLLYLLLGRFFLAKMLYADQSCSQCGLCVRQCPVNGVQLLHGHLWWSFRCESCMRCIGSCPSRSIQSGQLWLIVAGYIVSQPFAVWLFGGYASWLTTHPNWLAAANYPFQLLAIWIIMWPQWVLSSVRYGSQLLRFTTLTPLWRRYIAPGIQFHTYDLKTSR